MILVISTAHDEHAAAVLSALSRQRTSATLLDLSQFPQHMRLSMQYDMPDHRKFFLNLPDRTTLDLTDCAVIWWRRPQQFVPHPDLTRATHSNFALSESYEAFAGLWQSLDAFWVNHPRKDEVAHRKAFQLRVAQDVGLTVPRTLISNDPALVREFVAVQGYDRTIYKAFSATEQEWRETRLLRSEELALIDNVQYAPVIFQEYIEARYDLRITVVGDSIFPAAIYSQETAYKVDFRMDIANARIEAVRLPPAVEAQLQALMARLGLVYGAIDMRLTPDERYVFLEINPAGQWLFIEQRSMQPITACLATTLAKHNR
jgi:glutathione synthase/RimK-type ligase-like ATP-grasp enzyme